jgi:hypothetical protein
VKRSGAGIAAGPDGAPSVGGSGEGANGEDPNGAGANGEGPNGAGDTCAGGGPEERGGPGGSRIGPSPNTWPGPIAGTPPP